MKMFGGFFQRERLVLPGPEDLREEGGKEATEGQVSVGYSQRTAWERPTEKKNRYEENTITQQLLKHAKSYLFCNTLVLGVHLQTQAQQQTSPICEKNEIISYLHSANL